MTKTAKNIIYCITIIWSIIMLIASSLLYFNIKVSSHFSFEIIMEFVKAIALWYILGFTIAYFIDTFLKKNNIK